MIITKDTPFKKSEIKKLAEEYEVYIKTVIDIENKTCCAGMHMHYEGEQILLERNSDQSNIWGGGIDLETCEVDFNSLINIRPNDNNNRNEIQDPEVKQKYNSLTKYFFEAILKS